MDKRNGKILKNALDKGPQHFKINGKSMIPFYYPGMKVDVVEAGKIRLGDIILFIDEKRIIAHRVIFMSKGMFYTKGDYNLKMDRPIHNEEIIGKIVVRRDILSYAGRLMIGMASLAVSITYSIYIKLKKILKIN